MNSEKDRKKKLNYTFMLTTIGCLCLEVILLIVYFVITYKYLQNLDDCKQPEICPEICEPTWKDKDPKRGARRTRSSNKNNLLSCNTIGCVETANMLIARIDGKSDPCRDFHEFACGKGIQERSGNNFATNFLSMESQIYTKIGEFLKISVEEDLPKHLKNLKKIHNICEKYSENSEDAEMQYLNKTLNKMGLGNFEIVQSETSTKKYNWTTILSNIIIEGLWSSHLFYTGNMQINNNKNIIFLDQLKIGEDELLNSKEKNDEKVLFNATLNLMERIFKKTIVKKQQQWNEMKEFESLLWQKNENFSKKENFSLLTIKQLEGIMPEIEWNAYFRLVLHRKVGKDENIKVFHPSFFKRLSGLIKRTNSTTIANYLSLKLAWNSYHFIKSNTDCLKKLSEFLDVALTSAYIKAHNFSNDIRESGSKIVQYIKSNTKERLMNVPWLTKDNKDIAVNKIEKVIVDFPFIKEILNYALLDEYHKDLKFVSNSFLQSVVNMRKWKTTHELKQPKEVTTEQWAQHIKFNKLTSHYNKYLNRIEIGIQMLQNSMFQEDLPNYMNYGAIGSILAHELIKAVIPPEGYMFDDNGNKRKWWNDETLQLFHSPITCLRNQLDKFNSKDSNNINNSILENFVDNAGLKLARVAYLAWEKDNGVEYKLPGLLYTPRQLFWISAANVWCSTHFITTGKDIQKNMEQSLKNRFLGSLINNEEFSTDFNCPPGSRLNPETKCNII